jgi:hypothetical protein
MIAYLKQYFHPTSPGSHESTSLAIRSGKGGARLSHDHSKQYAYVLQSLTLWREILHGGAEGTRSIARSLISYPDMFHLWSLAEQDLLSEITRYVRSLR